MCPEFDAALPVLILICPDAELVLPVVTVSSPLSSSPDPLEILVSPPRVSLESPAAMDNIAPLSPPALEPAAMITLPAVALDDEPVMIPTSPVESSALPEAKLTDPLEPALLSALLTVTLPLPVPPIPLPIEIPPPSRKL